ncbi:MAG: DNA cytosine methyltransferase [Deltaproteobacteria bacterium]|nr:DNA cytosine methyltransferase [Deltaproteobacteria bacterium]
MILVFLKSQPPRPEEFIIKSEDYGIPQCRHRVIVLGIRDDSKTEPRTLSESNFEVNIADVISDLPPIRSSFSRKYGIGEDWKENITRLLQVDWIGENRIEPSVLDKMKQQAMELDGDLGSGAEFLARRNQPDRLYASEWFLDGRLRGYCNHVSKTHMPSDIQRYFFASCFASVKKTTPMLRDFPKRLLPEHKNVQAAIKKGNFNDRFRVQVEDFPATTITSHISKDGHYFIHPDPSQARSLTVREAARIQTFPDNFFFCGPRSQQYIQVGNAVPPLLARSLAEVVHGLIMSEYENNG